MGVMENLSRMAIEEDPSTFDARSIAGIMQGYAVLNVRSASHPTIDFQCILHDPPPFWCMLYDPPPFWCMLHDPPHRAPNPKP
jgi:hypothetical protein